MISTCLILSATIAGTIIPCNAQKAGGKPNKNTQQMTPIAQLESMMKEQYVTEDGDKYKVELLPGLSNDEINKLATQLPSGQIPDDIRELLKFASGFEFPGLDEVTFDGIDQFGMENIFPHSIQLAGDGFGNFWILDIDTKGHWGNVFFVCHDPAVIVKHSENLTEFIKHVGEFGKSGAGSNLDIIHEKSVIDIWEENTGGFIDKTEAMHSTDTVLKNFAQQLPDSFVIADLRNKPIRTGFAWGRFGPGIENAVRHSDELLWGFEKKARK